MCFKGTTHDTNFANGYSRTNMVIVSWNCTDLKRQGCNVVEVRECAIKRELAGDDDMKHYFNRYDVADPLEPRDALYGGRTNATKLYHECEEEEKIR